MTVSVSPFIVSEKPAEMLPLRLETVIICVQVGLIIVRLGIVIIGNLMLEHVWVSQLGS